MPPSKGHENYLAISVNDYARITEQSGYEISRESKKGVRGGGERESGITLDTRVLTDGKRAGILTPPVCGRFSQLI